MVYLVRLRCFDPVWFIFTRLGWLRSFKEDDLFVQGPAMAAVPVYMLNF